MEEDVASEKIENMNINYIGAELVFKSESSSIAQDSYIDMMHKKRKNFMGEFNCVFKSCAISSRT